ncbi:MAG: hypothetical protein H7Z72_03080 [Bacteroidetes bacterium]|nr:hypothetical protein [Fibrella sp.]
MNLSVTYIDLRLFLDGMLCMMALYALLHYAQHRKTIYWQYALYIGCMIITFRLDDTDYAQADYRPGANYWVALIESGALVLYIQFALLLMEIPRYDPFSARLLRYMALLLAGGVVLDTLLYAGGVSAESRSLLYTLNRVVLAGGALLVVPRIIRLKQMVVMYFIVGSFFFVAGCLLALCVNFVPRFFTRNPAEPFSYPVTIMQIGVVLEVLCFNLGMSLRNREVEREKIAMQAQLIEQLQENERKQQTLQRIRQDIARELHDDLGADLSGLSLLSSVAAGQVARQPDDARATLKVIGETARRVVTSMREIIWSLNATHLSVESTLFRLRQTAYALFEHQSTELHLELPADIGEEDIPPESRRELFLMFKEILHNTARHAQAQQVHVQVVMRDQMLCLTVHDDGIGFDVASGQHTGNGLASMYQRADALGGQLNIDSEPGRGTSVYFCGPVVTHSQALPAARLESLHRPV